MLQSGFMQSGTEPISAPHCGLARNKMENWGNIIQRISTLIKIMQYELFLKTCVMNFCIANRRTSQCVMRSCEVEWLIYFYIYMFHSLITPCSQYTEITKFDSMASKLGTFYSHVWQLWHWFYYFWRFPHYLSHILWQVRHESEEGDSTKSLGFKYT